MEKKEQKEKKGLSGCQIGFIFLLIGMVNSATFAKSVGTVIFVLLAVAFLAVVFGLPFLNNRGE